MPTWLNDACFYEIYPQTFCDSNGDGIGDIQGIIQKLDYIRDTGFNALWINPCFDSPFKDAGYDVRDYKKVAPRYGSNEDLIQLFQEAHRRGIHVLLDLVPGHTSEEHEWFLESKKAEENAFSDRYVWTNFGFQGAKDFKYVAGESDRDGAYILNFFNCQPALNYGFGRQDEKWMMAPDSPAAIGTREAMKDVMKFWMDLGCDGFRVDMASSLVKNDTEDKKYTQAIWQNVRSWLDQNYPEAAIVSEWGYGFQAFDAGFHMDFTLNDPGCGYTSLFRDYSNPRGDRDWVLLESKKETAKLYKEHTSHDPEKPWREDCLTQDHSYFRKDGHGDITTFLADYEGRYAAARGKGYISLITGNHDTPRINFTLDDTERRLSFAFIYTMPGVPFMYYGDEIGMKYRYLPSKEGGFQRTGSRTPMQWTGGKNLGFSEASEDALYLPVEDEKDAPNVESQLADEGSLLHFVKDLLKLRHENRDLQADGSFEVLHGESRDPLFVYRRGDLICAVNPSGDERSFDLSKRDAKALCGEKIFSYGETGYDAGRLTLGGQSFLVLK